MRSFVVGHNLVKCGESVEKVLQQLYLLSSLIVKTSAERSSPDIGRFSSFEEGRGLFFSTEARGWESLEFLSPFIGHQVVLAQSVDRKFKARASASLCCPPAVFSLAARFSIF